MSDVGLPNPEGALAPAQADGDRSAGVGGDPGLVPDPADVDAPAVVAVVVACDPGPSFAETLRSLGSQDYENLSVLVVDAGSEQPIADRVAEVLPAAYLHRLAGDPGWSVAANQSIELVSGSPFLLFCHDDVILAPDCVSQLMSELYRSNGGIAGPKLVSWDDDRRMLQLGMGSDRFGVMVEQVDRGEFDQGQHDSVRDVFVVPGGVQLIRADLFAALGGFDPAIKMLGEDLDLCWRAHAAGARVLAVPSAKARHRESMAGRLGPRERRRLTTRHRLRTVLSTSTRRSLPTVVLAITLVALESLYALLAGRRGQAGDVLAAIPWNLGRLDDIRRKRRQLRRIRTVSASDIAKRQVGGSARLAAFSRGQFSSRQDRFTNLIGSVRSSFKGEDSGNARDAAVIWLVLGVLVVFGSRHLLTRGVIPVGQFPAVPDAGTMLREWWGGWRTAGAGGPGNPPTALLFLGLGRLLFFWAPGLFDTLLVIGPILAAPVLMYRLVRPLGSPRAGAVGAFLYGCNPLVLSAMSAARWEALVMLAAAPVLLGSLLRLAGEDSYGPDGLNVADRNLPVRLLRFGFAVALVGAFVPAVVPVAALMAAVLAVAVLALGRGGDPRHVILAVPAAVVIPVALHGPWSLDVLRSWSWRWTVGPDSPERGFDSMLDLLVFAPGEPPPSLLALGLVVLAVMALVVARRPYFQLVVAGWALALVFLALPWADRRGWIPVALPAADLLLAVVATGLSFAVASGVRSVEVEGAGSSTRLIRRRLLAGVSSLALLAVLFTGLLASAAGDWEAPRDSYVTNVDIVVRQQQAREADVGGPGRVLWIGDPSVLPVDGLETEGGISYALSEGGRPDVRARWLTGPVGVTAGIGDALDLARDGEIVRLGRLLAPYGIRNIVVADRLAPSSGEDQIVDPGQSVLRALTQQLDLQRITGVPRLTVFRNTSAAGLATSLPDDDAVAASTPVDQLDVDLLQRPPAPIINHRPGKWIVGLAADTNVLVGVGRNELSVSGVREELVSGFDGLTVIPAGPAGEVLVEHDTPWTRRLALFGQVLMAGFGALLAQTRREAHR